MQRPALESDALMARDGARLPVTRWDARQPSALVVALHSFRDYRAAFDELGPWFADRDDPGVLRRIRADSYAGVVWLAEIASRRADSVRVPVLILYGERDRTVRRVAICRLARHHATGEVELRIRGHWPHLLLHAPEPEQVANEILAWMNGERQEDTVRRHCPG